MATETITTQARTELDSLADTQVDSTDTQVRYMAYASRLRTALRASSRYIAYTSDVGEAFRPVISPRLVAAAYGVSWAYLVGDVAFEAHKARRRAPTPAEAPLSEPARVGLVAAQRGVFQAVASMALPALTIHTVVRRSAGVYRSARSARVRAWGPTVTGLAVVPLLPFLFDHPVEVATDVAFDWLRRMWSESRASEPGKEL